jgi:WD40 repeat protein
LNETNSNTAAVILVGNTNGNLYQYAAKTGKEIFHTVEEGNYIMAMDYAPSGRTFCTAGKDNIIRIYDEETKKIVRQLAAVKWHKQGHNNRVFSVKFKKDEPDILASGGWDQNVKAMKHRSISGTSEHKVWFRQSTGLKLQETQSTSEKINY